MVRLDLKEQESTEESHGEGRGRPDQYGPIGKGKRQ